MERPNSILGLAIHAARIRWEALGTRGRMVAVAAATFVTLAAASAGVHAMSCGSHCCGGCAAQQQQAHSGCPHSH
jgi:hypothetical protein